HMEAWAFAVDRIGQVDRLTCSEGVWQWVSPPGGDGYFSARHQRSICLRCTLVLSKPAALNAAARDCAVKPVLCCMPCSPVAIDAPWPNSMSSGVIGPLGDT